MNSLATEWLLFGLVDVILTASLMGAVFLAPRYLLFGFYVPEKERESLEVRRIRSRHHGAMLAVWAAGLAAGIAAGLWRGGASGGSPELAFWTAMIIQIGGLIPVWGSGRRQARLLKQARDWAIEPASKVVVDLLFRQRQRLVGNVWFLLHLAVAFAGIAASAFHWDAIPDPVPTHFGINGQPDAYSPKGFGAVYTPNFIQLGIILVFLAVNQSIRAARQQIDPERPEASRENQLRVRRLSSIFVYAISLLVVVFIGLIQSTSLYGWPTREIQAASLAMPALLILAVFGFVWYVSRHSADEAAVGTFIKEDAAWRGGGLFYYNKADPALMVEKRYGVGWTINFAHPLGIVIALAILIVPIAIVLLTTVFA